MIDEFNGHGPILRDQSLDLSPESETQCKMLHVVRSVTIGFSFGNFGNF